MDNYFLYHNGQDWALKKEHAKKALKVFHGQNKENVTSQLKNVVNNASVKIQKKDGTFQEERTYPRSIDPKKSEG